MQVREYALLTTRPTASVSLDVGIINPLTFDWLTGLAEEWSVTVKVVYDHGFPALKLGSLVGYLCSPLGEEIEILPKTGHGVQNPLASRRVLQNMLIKSGAIKHYEAQEAELLFRDEPIHEWVYGRFLDELQQLVGIGLRREYKTYREHANAIRGRIDMVKQVRQRPGQDHLFHIVHDVLSADRLENRLLKTALVEAHKQCRTDKNWRTSNALMHQLESLPVQQAAAQSFARWSDTRLLQYYTEVKPWCGLIVRHMNPDFQKGDRRGTSLLFSMERLFESFVYQTLKQSLDGQWKVQKEPRSKYLVENHNDSRLFALKPDLLLYKDNERQVLDTKWKLLDQEASSSQEKYGLSQSDFYQLFAYGQRYQQGSGHMMLIYPQYDGFYESLPPFRFDSELVLWVVPFCIVKEALIGGDWGVHFPALVPLSYKRGVE